MQEQTSNTPKLERSQLQKNLAFLRSCLGLEIAPMCTLYFQGRVSEHAWTTWENGTQMPKDGSLKKISDLFNLASIDVLKTIDLEANPKLFTMPPTLENDPTYFTNPPRTDRKFPNNLLRLETKMDRIIELLEQLVANTAK